MGVRSIAFMDESGLLGGTAQRFFALGFMKMCETGSFSDAAHRILDRAISSVPGAGPHFEFKFNSVTASSLPFHLELVDTFFAQAEYHFCAFIIDKERPDDRWQGCLPTVWDAYLSYAKMVVTNNIDSDEEVCVIADYLGKPKRSTSYLESELGDCVGVAGPNPGSVFNACTLDSCSSLAIQTVDLLVGGVRHSFLAEREPDLPRDAEKDAISRRIGHHVGRRCLAADFMRPKPRWFRVWECAARDCR